MARVVGYKRVPDPPARTMPFRCDALALIVPACSVSSLPKFTAFGPCTHWSSQIDRSADHFRIDLVSPAAPAAAVGTVAGRSRVAHNTLLNFLGLAVPLALAFFIVPIAALNLGPARFGLLGLAWAITEYLTLFDLGLGRALVKFVADALHARSLKLSEIVSLSMAAQLGAGLVGGAIIILGAPVRVHDVSRFSPAVAG